MDSRRRPLRASAPSAFTLVELVVVIIIIGVLAALVVPRLVGHTGKARHSVAMQQVGTIETAIQVFANEYQRYPDSLEELIVRPSDIDEDKWMPPTLKRKHLKDPWDRDYVYRYPGDHYEYDLCSLGRDGIEGGEGEDADIVNW